MSATNRPPTFDHLMSSKKTRTVRVPIFDDEAADAYDTAVLEFERAKQMLMNQDDLAPYRDAVLEAAEQVKATTQWIVLRSIGRVAYDDLIREHPAPDDPDSEQVRDYKEMFGDKAKPPFDMDTFPPALVAASAVEPKMTVEQATRMFAEWNREEVQEVYQAALAVNTRRRVVELGKERGLIKSGGK